MQEQSVRLLTLKINGQNFSKAVSPGMTLLEFIREEINLTGTKKGCDLGECGVCTVLADGNAILSCITLALECENMEITTIEGLAQGYELHPLQKSFVEKGALQCGYCTPGMIMGAVALLNKNPEPSEDQIKECLSGTICRCTGYTKIVEAVQDAAAHMKK